jgi:hypothetical protein
LLGRNKSVQSSAAAAACGRVVAAAGQSVVRKQAVEALRERGQVLTSEPWAGSAQRCVGPHVVAPQRNVFRPRGLSASARAVAEQEDASSRCDSTHHPDSLRA